MRKTLKTFNQKQSPDNDQSIVTTFVLTENEDGIELYIRKQTAEKVRSDIRNQETKSLTIQSLSEDQLLVLVETLEDWLEAPSNSTFFEHIEDIEGVIEMEDERPGYGRETRTIEREFDTLSFSVGEYGIRFTYPDAEDGPEIDVPSAEVVKYGAPQDYTNIDQLYKAIFDYFDKRYSGEIDYFDEGDSLVAIERNDIEKIEYVFDRFTEIVTPLKDRDAGKEPLRMDKEADVQYLLEGLLRLHFDTVHPESYLEEHSMVKPRIDFLLKDHNIGIEVKRPSETRRAKRIGKEIAQAKEKYRLDSNIDTLLVFVYDPDRRITNAIEFENDFSEETSKLTTKVTVTQ